MSKDGIAGRLVRQSDPQEIVRQLIVSLDLAENLGEVWEDVQEAARRIGVQVGEDESCHEAAARFRAEGVKSIWWVK